MANFVSEVLQACGGYAGDTNSQPAGYQFWCPGCNEHHMVSIRLWRDGGNPVWEFKGDLERPTFEPSVLHRTGHFADDRGDKHPCWCTYEQRLGKPSPYKCQRCHSYVEAGKIRFLADCSHKLAGQIVDMVPVDEWPY